MNKMTLAITATLLASTSALAQDADLIITGNIYTGDAGQPSAESVAVTAGRISCVGPAAQCMDAAGAMTQVMDVEGYIYPGFTDAHAHLEGIGDREMTLNLDQVVTLGQFKASVRGWIRDNPELDIVTGRGWIETHWPEKRFPSRWDLDEVAPNVPVILSRADGHAAVVNSAALKAAGISSETEAPFGGEILKNALGEPTGILVDAAIGLIRGLIPPVDDTIRRARITTGSKVMASRGWTGMHNMSVEWKNALLMKELSDSGATNLRVHNSITMEDADKLFAAGPTTSINGRIETRAIKMYMDGALGSRGAALLEPYSDSPESTGLTMMKEGESRQIMVQALREGMQVNTHAIGDLGNRLVLNWYEKTFDEVPLGDRAVAEPRWRIEHSQIVNPDDIPRFKSLGVIPSMQPSHAIGDLYFAPDRLGKDRLDGAYAWQTLIDSGVIIAGGSDAPVEQGQPMIEFYAAVARKGLDGFSNEDWRADEAVSRADAIRMFTIWPAIAAFQENDLGTIEVGKKADMSVFNVDLMTVPDDQILAGKAIMTIIDGAIAWQAED